MNNSAYEERIDADAWKAPAKETTSDELLDAYRKGKEEGIIEGIIQGKELGKKEHIDSKTQSIINTVTKNLKRAKTLSEKLFADINKMNYKCDAIRLKIQDIYTYNVIFIIDQNDYTKEGFLKVYEKSIKIEKKENTDSTFQISLSFTPDSEYLKTEKMVSDGYKLSYGIQKH